LALVYLIKRKRNEYEGFIARLESLTIQHFRSRVSREDAVARPAPERVEPVGAMWMPA
jgi:hypothetical protein